MSREIKRLYEFDSFRLDPAERQLLRDGVHVPLTPKVFETLVVLVERGGHLVEKEELLKLVWAEAFVEEANLARCVHTLRKALGEERGGMRYIETVTKRGYRFSGEVRVREQAVADAPIKTLAVLPFKSLLAGDREEALEVGMADTLISRLGNNREIVVRPVSSVRKYGGSEQDAVQAGRALAVDSVLEGSIQRRGENIRVNVRLIKTADGTSLWAGTFDEKFTDIFVVQDAIANKVAAALVLQLGGEEQKHLTRRYTENVEAYQFYLRGRFHWNKRAPQDLQKSIEHFKHAIALDPSYALAYAGLADAYTLLANAGSPAHEIMPKAREAALKAVSLDDDLAEAHAALGNTIIYYDYDFARAEREHKRAIELNPNYTTARHWYSELLMGLGRHEEALAEIRRALEIDPLSLILNRQYGACLLFARQYDAAVAQMKKTVELDDNFAVAHSTLSVAYRMKGDYAESVEELARFQELTGGEQTAALMRESFAKGGWQGFLRAMTGEPRPADLTPYNLATFHADLGENDEAFVELNKSYQNHEAILGLLKVDPRFDSLRDDPRLQDLLRHFRFPQ
jgi:DNA-binding winged helix-turn-helix (wHTH) protein/tetratricopeptide (TPR) repeat protein